MHQWKTIEFKNTELIIDEPEGNSKGTILLIHGTAPQNIDGEIPIPKRQEHLWKEKLPDNQIDLIIRKNANHAFGLSGNSPDMEELAKTINKWLNEKLLKKVPIK